MVVFNRIKRKINTVVGVLEKLRQDPRAYPRSPTPACEKGAELASQVLLYALGWNWETMSAECGRQAAIAGIAGVEMVLVPGDKGDPEVQLIPVDSRDFFYDPNSQSLDFSDGRYEGTTRWVDLEEAQDQFPDKADELEEKVPTSAPVPYPRDDDRRLKWWDHHERRVRLVDHWYKRGGRWWYTLYCGDVILEEGESPFINEKGESICKYLMFSADVDHDNDRYGFYRDWKGPQDEINQRRSKALHLLNTRRVIAERGAVDDVEAARREMARPDGWIEKNKGYELIPDDQRSLVGCQGQSGNAPRGKGRDRSIRAQSWVVGHADRSLERARHRAPAGGRHRRARAVFPGLSELEAPHLPRGLVRGAEILAERALDPRHRRSGHQPVRAAERLGDGPADGLSNRYQPAGRARRRHRALGKGRTGSTPWPTPSTRWLGWRRRAPRFRPSSSSSSRALPASVKKRAMAHLVEAQQPKPHDLQAIQIKLAQEQARAQEIQSHAELYMAQAQEALAKAATAGMPAEGGAAAAPQVDTAADLAKASLDIAKAREIYASLSNRPEPGAFQKAKADAARAMREQTQAQRTAVETANLARYGAVEPAKIPKPEPAGVIPMTRSLGLENKRPHRRIVPAPGRSAPVCLMNPSACGAPLTLMAAQGLSTGQVIAHDFRLPGYDPITKRRAVLKPAPLNIGQGCCGSRRGGRKGKDESETKCAHGVQIAPPARRDKGG